MELIFRTLDTELDIPLDEWTRELLLLQYQRAEAGEDVVAFQSTFAKKVQEMVRYGKVDDLRLPSDRQIVYAARIAAEMGISLAYDVLRYRGAMSEFLERYAPLFQQHIRGEPIAETVKLADAGPDATGEQVA